MIKCNFFKDGRCTQFKKTNFINGELTLPDGDIQGIPLCIDGCEKLLGDYPPCALTCDCEEETCNIGEIINA